MTTLDFLTNIINYELLIVNAPITALDVFSTNDRAKSTWYRRYSFKSLDQFIQWRTHCFKLMFKYRPHSSKIWKREMFSRLNLQYGLKYDFDVNLVTNYENFKKHCKKASKNI